MAKFHRIALKASPGAEALKPIGLADHTLTVGSWKAKAIDGA